MSVFNLSQFMAEWRASRLADGTKIGQAEYDLVLSVAMGLWKPKTKEAGPIDPPWLSVARELIGQKEVIGPKHNNWISKGWARLGASWFNDDETPWCGFFVAHCIQAAGLEYPSKGLFARAKAWLDWGKPCNPVYGAIVIFARAGGGHVGILVGESPSSFYVLGGNQSNAVSITPIAKDRAVGFRWPVSLALGNTPLPKMSGGTISTNER